MPPSAPSSPAHWPPTSELALRVTTLPELLRVAATRTPDRVALVDATAVRAGTLDAPRRRWTYGELWAEVVPIAAALAARLPAGTRAALWGANSAEWIVADLACSVAGLVVVPLNPASPEPEVLDLLQRTRPGILLHGHDRAGDPLGPTASRLVDQLPVRPSVLHSLDRIRELVAEPTDAPSVLPTVAPTDLAQIQFTSGTTGRPKGVMLHHRGLVGMPIIAVELLALTAPPIWLNVMPLFHIGGCGLSTVGPIASGGTQVLANRFEAAVAAHLVEAERVNIMGSVPTMLIDLMAELDRRPADLSSLEVVMSGGAPVAPDLVREVERRLGARFVVAFGQTESHGHITQVRPDDSTELKAETVGRPLPHVEVLICDPETGRTLDRGEPGEVCTRSPFVMAGYADDPSSTRDALRPDGFLRTGDLATMDADGYLRVVGRVKELICRGGENIAPREIELWMATHPDVVEIAVVGVPDDRLGEAVAAFVRLRPAATTDADDLAAWAGRGLARHKVPATWTVVDDFPRTAAGKIRKHALRDRDAS